MSKKPLNKNEVLELLGRHGDSIVDVLRVLQGYYLCPKDTNGRRMGPLVAYTATYAQGFHWVGDAYLNFAKIEHYPFFARHFAEQLALAIHKAGKEVDVILGAPEGGKTVAEMTALALGARYVYPEKVVTKAKTPTSREESYWIWGRHDEHIYPDERVAIGEDLMNNFATIKGQLEMVWGLKAHVVALIGWYNRSVNYRLFYPFDECGNSVPIITLAGESLNQYRQDDPAVAADVAAGNVVMKPKHEWPRLEEAMRLHSGA